MDRRAALAKLGGSVVVGAGAVLVQSSAAFADFGSVFCRPTDCTTPFGFTLTRVGTSANPDYAQASMFAPAFGCAPGYTSSVQYRYRVVRESGGGGGGGARVVVCGTTSVLATNNNWSAFTSLATVCIFNRNSFTNLNNGIFRLEVIERRLCNNGVRSCWCCVGQFRRFQMQGAAGLVPLTSGSFVVSDALCN